LAAIKAIVETLQDGAIDDQAVSRDFLNKVNAEVDSMTQMVNELIELSRIETGKPS
jgi:two-component system phosphate regulon sensor histidine kinase PhoR